MTYLANHPLLSSNDLHQMRELLSALANTARIDVLGKRREIDGVVHSASFSDLNLTHLTYGDVPTSIQDHEDDADVLLLIVLTGGAGAVHHQGQEFDISPDVGLMRDIRAPLTAYQDRFSGFALPLPLATLRQHACAIIGGESCPAELRFDARLDMTTPGGRHVHDAIHFIANALDGPLRNLDNAIVLDGFKDLLLTSILTLLPNSYAELLDRRATSPAIPRYVKRARDYIHDHAQTSITLENLVRHAGCGYRTLQTGFNSAYGMPPMAYVKSVRLSHVHQDLLNAGEGVSVLEVAEKWGFIHMGRFAQSYVKQFGVLPSQTLRNRK